MLKIMAPRNEAVRSVLPFPVHAAQREQTLARQRANDVQGFTLDFRWRRRRIVLSDMPINGIQVHRSAEAVYQQYVAHVLVCCAHRAILTHQLVLSDQFGSRDSVLSPAIEFGRGGRRGQWPFSAQADGK